MVVMLLLALTVAAVTAQQPETLSLLGEPLYPPSPPKAERARLESELAQARAAVAHSPADPDAALRLARAQKDLGHVGDALETLTRAIEGNADAPALHLERGRGFVAIRKFELAQREFKRSIETIPEAHCDLAFVLYLLAEYRESRQEYGKCQAPGVFAYLAARRAGENAGPKPAVQDSQPEDRPITLPGSVVSSSTKPQASRTGAYMEAVERLLANQQPSAKDLLKRIVEKHKSEWMEPVYVAAENDYARIVNAEPKKKKTRRRED